MKTLPMLRRFEVKLTLRLVVLAHDEGQARYLALCEVSSRSDAEIDIEAEVRELTLPDNVMLFRRKH